MLHPRFPDHETLTSLQHFLAAQRARTSEASYFQLGDLMWRMAYEPNHFDLDRDLRIWTSDSGEIVGLVVYLARERNPEFFLTPEGYSSSVATEMIDWVQARAAQDGPGEIETSCTEGFPEKVAFLERHGFTCFGDPYVFMELSLTSVASPPDLPVGYSYSFGDADAILPGITRSTTTEYFTSVATAPFYRPDLAIRVAFQEDEIAAGCICWYDESGSCGELEPVGTAVTHRRKGLARAAVQASLHQLAELGARTAFVRTEQSNSPAVALYESLGFRITEIELGWSLDIS